MPNYMVTSGGKRFKVTMDSPPDQAHIDEMLKGAPAPIAHESNADRSRRIDEATIKQESGGNYSAIGPKYTKKDGSEAKTELGEIALGKYQIVPKFWFDKLGLNPKSEKDRQLFLDSKTLQDSAFKIVREDAKTRYPDNHAKQVAAYYGGSSAANVVGTPAGDSPQSNGLPSVNQYTDSVLENAGVLDSRSLAGFQPLRYPKKDANDPANRLYNNPEAQQEEVQEGVRQSISDLPIREQMGSGLGAFAYRMPGMGKLPFGLPGVAELSGLAPKGSSKDAHETIRDYNKNRSGLQLAGEMLPDVLISSLGGAAASKSLKLSKIGKAGYTGAKALMYGAEGLTAGGTSALVHQAQHVGSGEGLKGKEAAAEIIGSALLGTLGGKLGDRLVEVAPKILRRSLRPTLHESTAANPPDYTAALENNLIPKSGNLEKAALRSEAKLADLESKRALAAKAASQEPSGLVPHTSQEGEVLYMNPGTKKAAVLSDNLAREVKNETVKKPTFLSSLRKGAKEEIPVPMKESKKVGFVDGPLKESRASLEKEMSNPVKNKFTSETYDDAKSAFDHWEKEAMKRPTVKSHPNAQMTVEDALSFRQAIDKEIKFRKSQKTLTDGFNKASLMLREDLNKTIAKVAPDVGELTKQEGKILPFKKSLDNRVEKSLNAHLPAAGIKLSGLAGGALIGAGDSKNRGSSAIKGGLIGLSLAQLATTPGGAAIIYKAGKALQGNSLKKATFNQLIRSGAVKSRDK